MDKNRCHYERDGIQDSQLSPTRRKWKDTTNFKTRLLCNRQPFSLSKRESSQQMPAGSGVLVLDTRWRRRAGRGGYRRFGGPHSKGGPWRAMANHAHQLLLSFQLLSANGLPGPKRKRHDPPPSRHSKLSHAKIQSHPRNCVMRPRYERAAVQTLTVSSEALERHTVSAQQAFDIF